MLNDQRHEDDPYGDNLYLLASTLDPRFGIHWVDLFTKEKGEEVKEHLKGLRLVWLNRETFESILF